MSLSGLLARQTETHGDAVAIIDVDRSWTYSEISTQCGRVSAALCELGVVPGTLVGVHCNKGADGFVAMHAVVSAGAVAVPLDPGSPPTRLAEICRQMEIEVVISHAPRAMSVAALHEQFPLRAVVGLQLKPGSRLEALCIDAEELAGFDPAPPQRVDIDAPSYIITTSGSTGQPKGIVHTHSSARAYAEMALRNYGLTAQDRISDIAPYHFDISTLALWAVPLAGASNVVVNEPYQRLPASHSQLLQDQAVTIWYSVPFLLHQLVLRGDLENRDLSAMRWVHFGGEVIAPETIAEMMRHCVNARFANIFGPAETNQCTLAIFDAPPPIDRPMSIGFPLGNTDIRVVDPDADTPELEHCVAANVIGEMWTHSTQLMEGYWGQQERNSQILKDVDGKRYYRSGDLVSVDESGEIAFHGRVDHQVKVRGFRIEIEGVELKLEKLGLAEHVVVGVLRAHSGLDELVAGVLGTTSNFDEEGFLRAAASVLPSYAVPTHTVRIPALAFTASGKLDRRVLREHAVATAKGRNDELTS